MQLLDNNTKAFLALVRAGLWEDVVRLLPFGKLDYSAIMRLSEEQSVVGLVAAGLENVTDVKVPKEIAIQFAGKALQLEQRNFSMNSFIGSLVDKMHKADIDALLVKGQGIAQCYERPLWRACGDVDFYLNKRNYYQAQSFLGSLASHLDIENKKKMHHGMTIDSWVVELHGSLHTDLSPRINRVLDEIHLNAFRNEVVRSWNDNGITVSLPSLDDDVIIVFTHFLNHFFIEGVGLRQICDWCRLLWKYRDQIDSVKLKARLEAMGLLRVWRVFAALAVLFLGMPEESMPFYEHGKYDSKAARVLDVVLRSGNFGHNKDLSYRRKYSGLTYKMVSFWRRLLDFVSMTFMFPIESPRFFFSYLFSRVI